MAKVRFAENVSEGRVALIMCPGCNYAHPFKVGTVQEDGEMWIFNEDMESPTFRPAMMVNPHDENSRCHALITNGKIKFLGTCSHGLSNQTVDLPEIQ